MNNTYVEYEIFKNRIIEMIEDTVGNKKKVSVKKCSKNNGLVLDGLTLMEEGINISPTIYLNGYYEDYLRGKSLGTITDAILECYDRYRAQQSYDMSFFEDPAQVGEMIAYKLINYDMNRKLLENIPHRRLMDLAIVYFVYIKDGFYGNGSVLIRNEHLAMWNFSEEDLFERSKRNTPRIFKAQLRSMEEVIGDMLTKYPDGEHENCEAGEVVGTMYVLSNELGINGAGCMIYPDVMEELAGILDSDLYILPSSVHEVIIIPTFMGNDLAALKSMVREINRTEVKTPEVLSDEVYIFDRGERRLMVA